MIGPHKTERPISALADTDARRDAYLKLRRLAPTTDAQRTAIQARSVMIASDRKRLGQFAGTVREADRRAVPLTPSDHLIEPTQRLERPDQDTVRRSFPASDHVQAFMHAVDEINVGSARGPEYHPSTRSKAA